MKQFLTDLVGVLRPEAPKLPGLRALRSVLAVLGVAALAVGVVALSVEGDWKAGIGAVTVLLLGGVIATQLRIRDLVDRERAAATVAALPPDAKTKATARRLSNLNDARVRLGERLRWQGALRTTLTLAILGTVGAATALAFEEDRPFHGLAATVVALFVGLQVTRDRARELEADVRQLEYERAVIDADHTRKAETLFLKHQFELTRYYDQTLRQGALIFYVGLLVLALGAAVVVFALIQIDDADKGAEVVMAALAGVSGALTSFIASTYLKMYGSAVSAVGAFHKELVRDHNVHFAHLLMAKARAGSDAYVELARLAILRGGENPESPKPPSPAE